MSAENWHEERDRLVQSHDGIESSTITHTDEDEPARMRTMTMAKNEVNQSDLDRYGIERVPADMFLWGGYRYSTARDALAAAKRAEKP